MRKRAQKQSYGNPNTTEKHLKREIQAAREKKSLRFILVTDALEMLRDTSTLAEQQFHFKPLNNSRVVYMLTS